jgi:hypothetical protein
MALSEAHVIERLPSHGELNGEASEEAQKASGVDESDAR